MRNLAYFFIIAIGAILTLHYGKSMLIQLIMAFLLWFAAVEISKGFEKLKWFKKHIPTALRSVLIATFLLAIIYITINIIIGNLLELTKNFTSYEQNINLVTSKLETALKLDLHKEFNTLIGSLNIKKILTELTKSLSGVFSNFIMVLIYLLFIFLEAKSIKLKVHALIPDEEQKEKFKATLSKIENSLAGYFKVKTLTSLLTGFLSFIVLKIVGIDSAVFWAFLIFALNYIPTIGSLIATLFPAVFSLLQFGSFLPFILIITLIGSIQLVIGNFIEPKLMGKTLNVSPMVTIMALAIWGKLWGVIGMLFSVPITVIAIIVLSQFKSTQKIAILLSEKGEL